MYSITPAQHSRSLYVKMYKVSQVDHSVMESLAEKVVADFRVFRDVEVWNGSRRRVNTRMLERRLPLDQAEARQQQ